MLSIVDAKVCASILCENVIIFLYKCYFDDAIINGKNNKSAVLIIYSMSYVYACMALTSVVYSVYYMYV